MKTISLQSHLATRLLSSAVVLIIAAGITQVALAEGLLSTVIFGIVMFACGMLMLFHRHYIEIDHETGIVSRRRGFLYAFRMQSVPISEIRRISLVPRAVRRSEEDRIVRFCIRVQGKGKTTLAELSNPWAARRVCECLCKALGVPFNNRVYGPSSVRSADELDLSVTERWQRAKSKKQLPALPEQTRLEVVQMADGVRILMRAETHNIKYVAFVASIFAVLGTIVYLTVDERTQRLFFLLFFGASGIFLACAALAFTGKSQITIRNGSIEFRQGSLPKSRKISITDIEEMIPAGDGFYLVGDAGTVWIQYSGRESDNEYVQRYIEYAIALHRSAG